MPIRHRITLAVFLIGALVSALLMADRTATARSLLYARVNARAEALAEEAAFLSASALKENRFEALKPSLRAFRALPGVARLTVTDARGRPIFEDPPPRNARKRLGGVIWTAPIADGDEVLGQVYLKMSSQALDDALDSIVWRGAALSLAGLAALAAVSWLIGAGIGRRLESLADALDGLDGEDEVELPSAPAHTELGRLVANFRRLRERLRLERARRLELEAARDDLTHMLVHDMKHPLSVFRLAVGLVEESEPGSDGTRTAVSLARRGMARLEAMVEEILQVARLREAAMPVLRERSTLEALLAPVFEENRELIQDAGRTARIECSRRAGSSIVHADPKLIRRILGNLALNAIDHAPPGGIVRLGTRVLASGRVEVFVANSAPELTPERLARAFDKYRTYEESAAHAGLGLAFCRLAAEAQGGRMKASLLPNGEVEFALALPALAPSEELAA